MSTCPKCKDIELTQAGGRASRMLRCTQCRGTWMPKNEARLEGVAELLSTDSTIRPGSAEDDRTGLCPEGHGILIRALVEVDEPYYLERCAHCHGIWFDKGEWNHLAESHLFDHLDRLWDPAWRFRLKRTEADQSQSDRLKAVVGAPTLEMIETLATALRGLGTRAQSEAIAYLEDRLNE